ncbi:MAG: polysaccharide deacetylase family protein [Pseudomonadota bacterium]
MILRSILTVSIIAFFTVPGSAAGPVWTNFMPNSHGSAKILSSCFTSAQLAGKPGEKKTRKRGPGAFLKAPKIKRPKTAPAELAKSYRGSIRRVNVGNRKLVALGFDIGEQNNDFAGYDAEIIDFLRENKIKATMYVGGKWMATHAERARQLIADPLFEIGNHAWTHGNFRVLGKRDVDDQIQFTQAQYEKARTELAQLDCVNSSAMRSIPKRIPTFRFPYGTCNARSLAQVNDAGLPAVQWDVVTGDPAPRQSARAIARALLRVKPGSIVVAHANGRGWNTGKALKIAIPKLLKEGWEFVTVSELLSAGKPVIAKTCYENRPGDNKRYDRIFGKGTGD